jgi:hypothetical protein
MRLGPSREPHSGEFFVIKTYAARLILFTISAAAAILDELRNI